MSHTLHREGTVESLSKDFVVLAMPCQGRTTEGSGEKLRRFFEIARQFHPVNMGNGKVNNMYGEDISEIIRKTKDADVCHAVFNSQDDLVGVLKALKTEDLGLSIVVSGLMDVVGECCHKADLTPHTVNMSLGIFGRKEKLVPDAAREVTTMCGHGMVTGDLVFQKVDAIKKGRSTPEKAAKELASRCVCGIYNPARCAELLAKMASS